MTDKDISYDQYRNSMRNGDVLLFGGTGLVSNLIKARTQSKYSHVGIVAWWNKRLMVLEAVGKGVRAMPLSTNVKKYHGGVDYFRCTREIDDGTRGEMLEFAQLQLGKEYAHLQLFKFAAMHLLGMQFSTDDGGARGAAGQYFCSQYVSDIYARHGHDLMPGLSNRYTSPDALANSELLEFVGTLKKYESEKH